MIRILLTVILLCGFILRMCAQTTEDSIPRPVTGIYGVEIGGMSAYSTYLSPLTYAGTLFGVYGDWRKALPFSPENSVMAFDTHVSGGSMLNPAQTARMIDLDFRIAWGMAWRKRLPYSLQATAGGEVATEAGLLWLPRNGNNPVAARAYANIAIKGSINWKTRIGRLPILLTDDLRLPLAGAFFSPAYGETYYEIYLGNHKGLVHTGWPGNHFTMTNILSAILDFGRTAMQIGYKFSADTSWTNNINTQLFRHALVLGVVPGGMGIKTKKNVNTAWY